MKTIGNEITKIELSGFEYYNIQKLFFYISEFDRINPENNEIKFYKLLFRTFYETDNWNFEKGSSNIVFFLQNSTRQDVVKMVKSVANIVENRNFIYLSKKKSLHLSKFYKYLKLLIKWNKELRRTNLTRNQINKTLNVLLRMTKLKVKLEALEYRDYKLLVNFYDAETIGNFVSQTFKLNDVKTATLSHGIVLAERDNSIIDYAGIELKGFVSDFFLAWNNLTKYEAAKQGVDIDKIKVLGIPKFLGWQDFKLKSQPNVLGVVLDNWSGDIFNKILIDFANKFCKRNDFKYTIRFHPSFNGKEYNNFIDQNYFIGNNKSSTIANYSENVEFTIIANSTVFIELVYIKHKVYRYSIKDHLDKFRDLGHNTFENFKEFEKLYKNKIDESDKLFDKLCTVKDVDKSYYNFFNDFLILN